MLSNFETAVEVTSPHCQVTNSTLSLSESYRHNETQLFGLDIDIEGGMAVISESPLARPMLKPNRECTMASVYNAG
jgi:hypothetical protein